MTDLYYVYCISDKELQEQLTEDEVEDYKNWITWFDFVWYLQIVCRGLDLD